MSPEDSIPAGESPRGLRRVTVNLIPRAWRALQLAVELGGDNQTDTINRALQLYAFYLQTESGGGTFCIRDGDGVLERLRLF